MTSGEDSVYWLGTVLDLKFDMIKCLEATSGQHVELENLKPSQMNALQRSMVSHRVAGAAKDSTASVAMFLQDVLRQLDMYLRGSLPSKIPWKV